MFTYMPTPQHTSTPDPCSTSRQRYSSGPSKSPLVFARASPDHALVGPKSALHVGPQYREDSTVSRTQIHIADFIGCLGSQFSIVPRKILSTTELGMGTRSLLNERLRIPIPISKSLEVTTACVRCIKDDQECRRQNSTLHKGSPRCQRCMIFDYSCDSSGASAEMSRKKSDTKLVTLPPLSNNFIPAPESVVSDNQHETPQKIAANVELSDETDCRKVSHTDCTSPLTSTQEGQYSSTSYADDMPWLTKKFSELVLPHSSHHEQSHLSSTGLLMHVEALVNQMTNRGTTACGSTPGGISSEATKGGSQAPPQLALSQPLDIDKEPDQDDSDDEDEIHTPENENGTPKETTHHMLTCPVAKNQEYIKRNPQHFRCLKTKIKTMTHLRQHIKKSHQFCCMCYQYFGIDGLSTQASYECHISGGPRCSRCHGVFQNFGELKEHGLLLCQQVNRSSEEKELSTIWEGLFPGEPHPASFYVDYVPESQRERDHQLGIWFRRLSPHCRVSIKKQFLDEGIVKQSELAILDIVLGLPTSRSDTPSGPGPRNDTNALNPAINIAAAPSTTGTPFSWVHSQRSSTHNQAASSSQQDGSVSRTPSRQVIQSSQDSDRPYFSQSVPSMHQGFSPSQNVVQDLQFPPAQPNGQPQYQLQVGQYGGMPLSGQGVVGREAIPPNFNQQLYLGQQPVRSRQAGYHYQHAYSHQPNQAHPSIPSGQYQQRKQQSLAHPPNPSNGRLQYLPSSPWAPTRITQRTPQPDFDFDPAAMPEVNQENTQPGYPSTQ